MNEYFRWCEKAVLDVDLTKELKVIAQDQAKIEDAFYRDLAFGTGGLRGIIGAGTNRMNVYTVAKASQGLANYVFKNFPECCRRIAVSYDSRIKSDVFAKIASCVFAANGIPVEIYAELMPTPCLSYAVRALGCTAGIMITASHNPSQYNGYKVYGADGCQITDQAAATILDEIEKLDIFEDVKTINFDSGVSSGLISYIGGEVYTAFVEEVKKQSVLYDDEIKRDISIVYSPLNGTGLKPVLRTLRESGFTGITVVSEQKQPDGNFPTCPYPNPEIEEAMELGMKYAVRVNADLLLATDPDCDRVGIAVRNDKGEMELISGNETGILLLDYICSQRTKHGKMPADPVLIKTIVTSDLAERIANHYGVRTVNVLTGFKYIGEQIGVLEQKGKINSYLFGFEESYGVLSGTYIRDKDAVNGSFLICEMVAYYKTRGISLTDKLAQLYSEYGYCLNSLHSYKFEGQEGFDKMKKIMARFREGIDRIGSKRVEAVLDYSHGLNGLPKSDVLKYRLDGNCSVVIRPSGTEPKLKTYITVSAETKKFATEIEHQLAQNMQSYFFES